MGSTLNSCLKNQNTQPPNEKGSDSNGKHKALVGAEHYGRNSVGDKDSLQKKSKDLNLGGRDSRKPTDVKDPEEDKAKDKNRSESASSEDGLFQSKPIQQIDLKKDDQHQTMKRDKLPLNNVSTSSVGKFIFTRNSFKK
jgi:hypothetical protein